MDAFRNVSNRQKPQGQETIDEWSPKAYGARKKENNSYWV
jgi:hypothetical protein